jgi:hypothetical protein
MPFSGYGYIPQSYVSISYSLLSAFSGLASDYSEVGSLRNLPNFLGQESYQGGRLPGCVFEHRRFSGLVDLVRCPLMLEGGTVYDRFGFSPAH